MDVFVGRDDELTRGDRAGLVLISGEAGIGKTRLAEELAARIAGCTVWGRAWEGEGTPAYWPWLEILRALRAASASGPIVIVLDDRRVRHGSECARPARDAASRPQHSEPVRRYADRCLSRARDGDAMIRAAFLVAALTATAHAEPDRYSLGVDLVSATLLRGIGFEAGLRDEHWRGRLGYSHQNIPSTFVDMDSRNKGWNVTADLFIAAGDYWFGTSRDGFYVTLEAAVNRVELRSPSGASTTPYDLSATPGAGYHWSPFSNAFYVEPRLFLVINTPMIAGSEMAGGETYHHPVLIPAGWLVLGAAF